MRICFVFPSRSRPLKFFKTLSNIREMCNSDNYFVLAKIDEDDPAMNRPEILTQIENKHPEVIVKLGLSKNKVDAINRSMEDLPPCDIIILQSDDIQWDVKGFDNEIRQAFEVHFPDFSGTIHVPDDHGKKKTIIVSILGINLYRRLGYLYHPNFISVFADDFFTAQARRLKKYVFIDKRLFSHLHPVWKLAEWDEQYLATESKKIRHQDRETFMKLQANNYAL